MNPQSRPFKILFITEMLEQYGFYTMQSLLVFFLIQKAHFSDALAYAYLGQFAALVYLTPVIGGWVADKYLGSRIAILFGGLLLCAGYGCLALGQASFFAGLSLIIMGNGLFKPNVPRFLGEFYAEHSARVEAAFTLFYVGINLGALLGMLIGGYIQKCLGWSACFSFACFSLISSMSIFHWGRHYFGNKGLPSNESTGGLVYFAIKNPLMILLSIIAFTVIYYSLTRLHIGNLILILFGLSFLVLIASATRKMERIARRRIAGLIMLLLIAVFYKAMFFETYSVVNVYTDRMVDRTILGSEIPATVFLALGGFFTLILGPAWAKLLQSKKFNYSIPLMFSLSILLIGCCLQLLASLTLNNHGNLSAIWIVLFRMIFTVSELFIFPIGLSMVAEYAPKSCVAMMMGVWYMSAAFGGKLSGLLGTWAAIPKGIEDTQTMNMIYHHAFQSYASLCFVVFIVCMVLRPFIQNLLAAHDEAVRAR